MSAQWLVINSREINSFYAMFISCNYRDETAAQVNGYSKAEYMKFSTEHDARAYLSGPLEVTENMTTGLKSDGESHMDEQASCNQ